MNRTASVTTTRGGYWPLILIFIGIFLFFAKGNLLAQPAGFSDNLYLGGFNQISGFTWDNNGRMYAWETVGKVWVVVNGVKQTAPLLDISEEVGAWRDFGLLGFALDPNFTTNGYIYLLYVVDRHHLTKFGTGQYSASTNEYFAATIGRVTRYQVNTSTYNSIVPGSRAILMGATAADGNPVLHESHGTGALAFGQDGTLLVSLGDGASYSSTDQGSASETYYAQALTDGIITAATNIGAYRSQSLNSLNGKILRLDPTTGDGLPSNPYYDAANPHSIASRTWARGLRNPYRFTHVPETGSHNPADGNPGVFLLGDVGWGSREEMDVVDAPGMNFGWPKFEGMTLQPGYNNATYAPATHHLPKVDWRTGAARGLVNGSIVNVGSATLPGNSFTGNASTGGVWYHGHEFPPTWHDTYFHADYGGGWIRNFRFDANMNPIEVSNFVDVAGACVFINTHPTQGGIWYVRYPDQIRRVSFTGTTNRTPVAFASASPNTGASPLTVQFSSFNTYDQDGGTLSYLWNFGDGTTSTAANPVKTYSPGSVAIGYNVTLTVTDNTNLSSQATVNVSLNNTAPDITATSVDAVNTFNPNATTPVSLSATVSDPNHSAGQLTYAWEVILFHNEHLHPVQSFTTATASVNLTPIDCYNASYWYRVKLKVSDPTGASDFYQKDIFPACAGTSQTLSFSSISDKLVGDAPFSLTASSSSGLPVIFYVTEGPAQVLGNTVTLLGVPGKVTIAATQPGNGAVAPAINLERSFWVNTTPPTAQNQTITFPIIPNKTTNDPPFSLTATASSGLPVTYTVVSGPATVSGSTVTLTGQAGTVTIRASQAGNSLWNAAPPVDRSFTVSQQGGAVDLSLSVTTNPASVNIYNHVGFTFTVTNNSNTQATNVRVFVPLPSTVVYSGSNEYAVSQGIFDYFGTKIWYLGNLPANGSATITVNWFLLAAPPLTGWAEVSACDQLDPDSTPGNGTPGTANEDDEAARTINVPGQGPQNQTITFPTIPNKLTTDAPFALTATASSGLAVSYQVVSGPATLSGSTLTLNGQTGTVTVRASQAGNASWNAAAPVERSFTVSAPGLSNQTITFNTPQNKLTTDAPFTISASASSGLPVSFTVVSGPATVSGSTVTLSGTVGTVTIRASQAGNAQYNPAPTVDRSFQVTTPGGGTYCNSSSSSPWVEWISNMSLGTINNSSAKTNYGNFTSLSTNLAAGSSNPFSLTTTWSYTTYTEYLRVWIDFDRNNLFDDAEIALETIITPPASGANVTKVTTGNIVVPATASVGATRMRVSLKRDAYATACEVLPQGEVEDYTINLTSGGGPQPQTINFATIPNKVTTDAPFTISATATSGLPVSFGIVSGPATVSGNTITLGGTVGTVTVRATQAGNASWNAAAPVERSFSVSAPGLLNQTITFNALPNRLTTDPPFTLSATASSGLPVAFTLVSGPATLSGSTVTLTGTAGTVSIRASQTGNAQYNPAPDLTRSFAVNAPGGGGPDLELAVTASSPNLLIWNYVTFTVTVTNNGTVAASGVRVSVPVPQGLAHSANTPPAGTTYNLFSKEWTVGSLAAGQSKTMTILLFCLQNTTPLPYFVQVKTASPADVDSTPGNNTSGTPVEDDEALWTLVPPPNPLIGALDEVCNLSVKQEGATAKLRWNTNSGEHCVQYGVERSPDGFVWTPIAEQQNDEPTDNFITYRHTDLRPLPGWNFYRIVQLRNDGSLAFSNVQMLEFWEDFDEYKLFPNPAGDYVDINLWSVEGQIVRLLLVDRAGRLVKEMELQSAPLEPVRIDLTDVPEGWYVVWIQAAGRRARGLPLVVGKG